ncbi:MAG: hypothetical protein QHH75_15175 [Bacillota bacterium]|nr:hypothetical protein [Bacillota bacterium]
MFEETRLTRGGGASSVVRGLPGDGDALGGRRHYEGNSRTEIFRRQVLLLNSFFDGDTNTIITYYPDQNKAVKLSGDRRQKTVLTPKEYMGGVDSARAKLLEKTVYDGVSCRVVLIPGADGKEEVRLWVREDYGIPVRVEVTSAAGEKTVMEYKNLRVGPLPPDTFKLPPGVEVTDLNKMMERLPSEPGGQ